MACDELKVERQGTGQVTQRDGRERGINWKLMLVTFNNRVRDSEGRRNTGKKRAAQVVMRARKPWILERE